MDMKCTDILTFYLLEMMFTIELVWIWFEFVEDLLREYLNQYLYVWKKLDLTRSIQV